MRRLLSLLASRAVTAYLFLSYAVFVLFLAIWGARIPADVVGRISRLLPFKLIYLLAGLHLASCLYVFWAVVRQRVSLDPPGHEPAIPIRLPPGVDLAAEARSRGLRRLERGQSVVLVRNRWSPVGTVLFHGALLLLPLAFVLSRATRFRGDAWIVEGHRFSGSRAEYYHVEPDAEFEARAPSLSFDVESVEATLWGRRLFFTDLRALLSVPESGTARPISIRLPEPARFGATRVTIRGFNYTPAFELSASDGRILDSGDLRLRLFPPGTEDSFVLPRLPYRFFVWLYPDSDGPTTTPLSKGYALGNALFHVAVTSGKLLVARGFLRPGEGLPFDGYRIAFPAIRRGGEILVHRDLGYPVLWAALVLALLGSVWRIAFPASRVWIHFEGERTTAHLREDAFAWRGAALLHRWGTRED